ncbi:MAG TPA: AAA family ATPase [Aggregatilineales bacterium]|nr:AAA family ATPase [Aggregatilineales bacterium]
MIQFYFLGAPHFEHEGRRVHLTSAKAVALLAYLALNEKPQARDHLLSLLWAESADEAARKNLRNTLWAIRKAFGDEVIARNNDRIRLNEALWVDVREFEAGAIACYGGTFLEGLTLTEAPEFELWMDAQRERLSQYYVRLLSDQIDAERGAGHWESVVALARRGIAQNPLQESLYRTLMEAHARMGDRGEAVRDYETLETILKRQLGVDPLPETSALRDAILKGTPIDSAALPEPPRPPRRPALSPELPEAPFVGREGELEVLDFEYGLAAGGHVRIVLLNGEIGIGKTRLWREWSSRTSGVIRLEARCLEATQSLPFSPLVDLFTRATCAETLFGPRSPVPAIWLAELIRLFPVLRVSHPDLPAHAVLPADEERQHVLEAFSQCFLALMRAQNQPLVLFLDDLHWADRTTLDWLGYVTHRLRDERFLIVAAYRTEDTPGALAHLAAGWARDGILRHLPLGHLSSEKSMVLITSLGGDPALADAVQQQATGNPYFLIELVRARSNQVPPALRDIVRARLDRLPDTARGMLQAAAVLHSNFDFADLQWLSGLDEEAALDAIDLLIGAAVLIEHGNGQGVYYDFTHPLVASIVQEGMSETRRAILNRRAAEIIETKHVDNLRPVAGRLARHYELAKDIPQAARFAQMAAEYAITVAAPTEAANFYRWAIALEPTAARCMGLGDALVREGEDLVGMRAAYRKAFDLSAANSDASGAARAALAIADTYFPFGQVDEASTWVQRGLDYLKGVSDPVAVATAHFILGASGTLADSTLTEAEGHLREAARLAADYGLTEVAARSRFELGNLLAQRGDLPGALKSFSESIDFARRAGNDFLEVLGDNNYAYHVLLTGDTDAARDYVEAGLSLAQSRAIRMPLQYLYSTSGEIALARGEWDEAERLFRLGMAEAQHRGNHKQVANYYANLGLAAQGRGDLDSALVLFETAHEAVMKLESPHLRIQIDLWLTDLYLKRGERTAAAEALARAEAGLAEGERAGLSAWAKRLRAAIMRS